MAPGQLINRLDAPVDAASLAVFRAGMGVLLVITTVRFWASGWVDREFVQPSYFFSYLPFIRPLPAVGMHALYAVMAISAVGIACGLLTRLSAALFCLAFTYAHLCDKTNYLNHYYLVSLLTLCLVVVPADQLFSLRAHRADSIRTWALWLFRLQVSVVYLFGGLAKIGTDWLLRGEPLHLWLLTQRSLPLVGPWLALPVTALIFSWCGFLFDLSAVPLLLWARTRRLAYAVVVVFHLMTSVLFSVGMFPWLMIMSATVLFSPSWPRRFMRPASKPELIAGPLVSSAGLVALVTYAVVQLALPLRHLLYPGNTLWSEEGFRFAWRVMLIEKQGALELTVVEPNGARTEVSPRAYLTPFQTQMASTQPDMILQLAHHVADEWNARGKGPVRVFADAQVSFNGRPHQAMIDPDVDLAAVHESFFTKPWVLPAPITEPQL